jgi:hypothetical protein
MTGQRKQHWQRLHGVFRACFYDERGNKLHPAGAAVLANLRDMVGYERSPFNSDPLRMAYTVGQQDVVKHIIQMLELTDDQIARLDGTAQTETELEDFGLDERPFN